MERLNIAYSIKMRHQWRILVVELSGQASFKEL